MRDPDRIDPLLTLVAEVWHTDPDLRLGQLLINAARLAGWKSEDIFSAEDAQLEKGLRRYMKLRHDVAPGDSSQYE